MTAPRAARIAAFVLGIAVFGAVWASWLVLVGGIDARIFGVSITSNEPMRPFVLSTLAGLLYAWLTGGFETLRARLHAIRSRVDDRLAAGAIAGAVFLTGVLHASTTVIGADSYGYVSQADLWIAGDLRIEQPWVSELPWPDARWTATPLGYVPNGSADVEEILPLYPPGLPLMMAAAKAGFGQEALFWIVPLAGAVLVLATFGIGVRLGSSSVGLVGAWFAATSPIVLFMLMPAMSDIPAAAAWATAACFALRGGAPSSVAAGFASGIAILIRPNLALLAGPIGVIVLLASPTWRLRLARGMAYTAGILPAIVFIGWLFNALYGSPFTSGYGDVGDAFEWSHVWPNARQYLTWLVDSQTWLGVVGLVAVIVPVRRFWSFVRDRRVMIPLIAVIALVVAQYLAYYVYDTWWFLRFFLPIWPYLGLGLAALTVAGMQHRRAFVAVASAWLVLALGLYNARTASKLGAFGIWEADRTHPEMSQLVSATVPEHSVVLSLIYSGALRYYGATNTLRYDILPGGWLDKATDWLSSRGVRTYALLEEWEIKEFEKRFRDQRAGDLSKSAVLIYRGIHNVYLFDLTGPVTSPPRVVMRSDPTAFRSVPPRPHSTFRFPK